MGIIKTPASSSSSAFLTIVLNYTLRFLQFVFALTVCGLYGTDLNSDTRAHVAASPKWIYAVVVAGFSAITSLVYCIPFQTYLFFAWDSVLFILWIAVFGTFGKLFLHDSRNERMRHAVWVDLINVFLWLISAAYGGVLFMKSRSRKSGGSVA